MYLRGTGRDSKRGRVEDGKSRRDLRREGTEQRGRKEGRQRGDAKSRPHGHF